MLDTNYIYKPRHSTKKSTTEQFIQKAIFIHSKGKYDYSLVDYKHSKTKVIIVCPIHGEFNQTPANHLSGNGCPKCSIDEHRSSIEQFIRKAIFVHGEKKYDYSKVDYKQSQSKVIIVCPEHGEFEQTPNNHLKGQGCPKCKSENQRRLNAIKFENTYPIGTLYFIRCWNDSEVFLKIGITSRTIDKRYSAKDSMPYNRETLYEWTGDSKSVVELEDKVKSLFLYHKPEIMFGGGHSETLHISQEKTILEFIRLNLVS